MACPQKNFVFLTELGNFKQKIFRGNAIGNVANQESTTLPRPDDSGQCLFSPHIDHSMIKNQAWFLTLFSANYEKLKALECSSNIFYICYVILFHTPIKIRFTTLEGEFFPNHLTEIENCKFLRMLGFIVIRSSCIVRPLLYSHKLV